MITRMNITFKSKERVNTKPKIYSIGGFEIQYSGKSYRFDFEESGTSVKLDDDGFLHVRSELKNIDEDYSSASAIELNRIFRLATKEDYSEIYYECFQESEDEEPIHLICIDISYYDFDTPDEEITVLGNKFNDYNGRD